MKIILAYITLLCCLVTSGVSQSVDSTSVIKQKDSVYYVGTVTLIGNERTKDFVILREMSLKEGIAITSQLIEYDKNRIYSLGLFNRVEIKVAAGDSNRAHIVVELNERWFLFPFPIFGIKDRDWDKAFYGFGVLHNNFRGRNEKLFASFVFGFDPSVSLYYRNSFLDEEGSYYLDARLSAARVRNRSLLAKQPAGDFDEKHFSIGSSVGRRFGIYHTVWISGGYEVVDISDQIPLRTFSSDGIDRFPILGLGYTYDTRDLREYPSSGNFFRVTVTKFGWPSADFDIVRYAGDARQFVPLPGGFVAGARVFTDLAAAGPTPSYNRVFFGYGERIRGHFKEVMEGENLFGATAEIHYPLLAPRYITVNFLPKEFGLWRFGMTAALFADAGTAWFRNQPFSLNTFSKGYGGGIHFLLPYSIILRTEYAWDENRKGEFIFDVGASL